MNFDLADLRAFVAVAKLSSFRAASEELHLSQPALSRRIEKLEDALGVRLFHRTTRKVDLTAVGREFNRRANDLLDGLFAEVAVHLQSADDLAAQSPQVVAVSAQGRTRQTGPGSVGGAGTA